MGVFKVSGCWLWEQLHQLSLPLAETSYCYHSVAATWSIVWMRLVDASGLTMCNFWQSWASEEDHSQSFDLALHLKNGRWLWGTTKQQQRWWLTKFWFLLIKSCLVGVFCCILWVFLWHHCCCTFVLEAFPFLLEVFASQSFSRFSKVCSRSSSPFQIFLEVSSFRGLKVS